MVSRGSGLLTAFLLPVVVLLSAAIVGTSEAADPVGKAAIAFRGGFVGLQMGDVNDGIDLSDRLLDRVYSDWKVPENLNNGFGLTADLTYDITPTIRASVVYGATFGETSVDYQQVMKVRASSGLLMPRVLYRLPYRPMESMTLRLYAGPVLLTGSKVKIEHENTSESDPRLDTMTIEGSGTGFAAGLAGEYTMADRFTLHFEAGYQGATASFDKGSWKIEKQRDPLSNSDASTGDVLPNNRDLPEESYLWGFMDSRYKQPADTEPAARTTDLDFSGYQLYAGLRVYLF